MVASNTARNLVSLSLFICSTLYILTLLDHNNNSISPNDSLNADSVEYISANVSCSPWIVNRDYVTSVAKHTKLISDFIVVTSSDWNYRGITINFVAHMYHIGVTNFIVLCHDKKTLSLIGDWENEGHGMLVSGCNSYNKIFQIRHRVAEVMLSNNLTVILSDGDCVWLQNFYASWILPYRYAVDVIAQMGRYPEGIFREYGAAACAGLLIVHPSPAGLAFYRRYISRMTLVVDDQVVLNAQLREHNAFQFDGRLPQGSVGMTNFSPAADGLHMPRSDSNATLRMAFLPHHKFPRVSLSTHDVGLFRIYGEYMRHDPLVWHIAPPKRAARGAHPRIYLLKVSGVFVPDSNWHTLTRWGQLELYMRSLDFKERPVNPYGLPTR